jgi:hypothetical protein
VGTYLVTTKDGKVVERTSAGTRILKERVLPTSSYEVTKASGEKVIRVIAKGSKEKMVSDYTPAPEKTGVAVNKYEVTDAKGNVFTRQTQRVGSKLSITESRPAPITAKDFFINFDSNMKNSIPRGKSNAALQVPEFQGDITPKGMDWWTNINYQAGKKVIESKNYQDYKNDFGSMLDAPKNKPGLNLIEVQSKILGEKSTRKQESFFKGFERGAVGQVVERPIESGAIVVAGVSVGYGASWLAGKSVAGALTVKTLSGLSLGIYSGSVAAKTIFTPGEFKKGKFLGGEAVKFSLVGLGSKIGVSAYKPPEPQFVRGSISESKVVSNDKSFLSSVRYRSQFVSGTKGNLVDVEGVVTQRGVLGQNDVFLIKQAGSFKVVSGKNIFSGKVSGRGFANTDTALNFEDTSIFKGGKLFRSFKAIDTSKTVQNFEIDGLKYFSVKGARFSSDLGKLTQFYSGVGRETVVYNTGYGRVALLEGGELGLSGRYLDTYAKGFSLKPRVSSSWKGIKISGKKGNLFLTGSSGNDVPVNLEAISGKSDNLLFKGSSGQTVRSSYPISNLQFSVLSQSKNVVSSLMRPQINTFGGLLTLKGITREKVLFPESLSQRSNTLFSTKSIPRQNIFQNQRIFQRQNIVRDQIVVPRIVQKEEVVVTRRSQIIRTQLIPPVTRINNIIDIPIIGIPIIDIPIIPPVFTKLGTIWEGTSGKLFKGYFVNFKPKYTASLGAIIFNIKGKENKFNAFTGLGIRPLRLN